MHASVQDYVKWAGHEFRLPDRYWPPAPRVLEVGSYNENGSVRDFFHDCRYIGVDVREGPGVDYVLDIPYPWDDDTFHMVVSTEMFEHCLLPWRTVGEMARVLRRDGTMLITARGYDERGCYELHDYRDVWRFTVEGMSEMLQDAGLRVVDCRQDPECPGVLATAVKP